MNISKGLLYELQINNYLISEYPNYNVFLWKDIPFKYIFNLKLDKN